MKYLQALGISLLALMALLLPLSAAAFLPIGGKIVNILPCPPNVPGYQIDVLGFGIGSGLFWYLPGATITYLEGPPFIGEWVLGLSDVPGPCGERATMTGTSLF